ncbi:MAG: methylmalonyl-CoA mutase family protein [Sphingomonas sp.]
MSSTRWAAPYYVEALTRELVDKAWEIIERVDAEGGMAKAVARGLAQGDDRGGRRLPAPRGSIAART